MGVIAIKESANDQMAQNELKSQCRLLTEYSTIKYQTQFDLEKLHTLTAMSENYDLLCNDLSKLQAISAKLDAECNKKQALIAKLKEVESNSNLHYLQQIIFENDAKIEN